MENLVSAIHALPDEYGPILHRPWVAPLNWGLMLYAGAPQDWIGDYREKIGRDIPDFYGRFLSAINGCFIYGLSLYGIPASMYEKNLLNRRVLQCHDLAIANRAWIYEYKVARGCFYFGYRPYTYSENVGYFWENGKIRSVRKNGKTVGEWTDFTDLLREEIAVMETKMLEGVPKDVRII